MEEDIKGVDKEKNTYKGREDTFEKSGIFLVGKKNKSKYVLYHYPYRKDNSDFDAGFYEAMDMFKYMWTYFNIATCDELWPPVNDYDKNKAYDDLGDGKRLLKWNFFWEKFENGGRSPWKFYDSLDHGNKLILYDWYKRNVKKE